jgi:hypothetical protein
MCLAESHMVKQVSANDFEGCCVSVVQRFPSQQPMSQNGVRDVFK